MNERRGAFNLILQMSGESPTTVASLWQRGQILTWTREIKTKALSEIGVTAVVNLWPKADPDLADLGLDFHLQLPCARSEQTLESRVTEAARYAATYLSKATVNRGLLVLCEAGKTRSVYFCVLVSSFSLGLPIHQALAMVESAVPRHSMKRFMYERFEEMNK
jgi:hypothetical protein